MSSIRNMLDALLKEAQYTHVIGNGLNWGVYVASQNYALVVNSLASLSQELSTGVAWDWTVYGEDEIKFKRDGLLRELWYRHRLYINVLVKPWPAIGGDFFSIDTAAYERVWYDLDADVAVPTIDEMEKDRLLNEQLQEQFKLESKG